MRIFKRISLGIITFAASITMLVLPNVVKEVEAAPTPSTSNTTRFYFNPTWTDASSRSIHYWFSDSQNNTVFETVAATSNMFTLQTIPSVNLPDLLYTASSDSIIRYVDATGNDTATITGIIPIFKQGSVLCRPGSSSKGNVNVTGVGSSDSGFTGSLEYGKAYYIVNSGWKQDVDSSTKRYNVTVSHYSSFITLNLDGGSITGISKNVFEVAAGGNLDLSSYVPTKTGYIFRGWYLSTDSSQNIITTVNGASPVNIVAKWEEALTLTLDANGGYLGTSSTSTNMTNTYEMNTYVDLTTYPIPMKLNYSFAGWYNSADLSKEIITNLIIIEVTTLVAKWNETVLTHDRVRIYLEVGHWTPAIYNVNLGLSDGANYYQRLNAMVKTNNDNEYSSYVKYRNYDDYVKDFYATESYNRIQTYFQQDVIYDSTNVNAYWHPYNSTVDTNQWDTNSKLYNTEGFLPGYSYRISSLTGAQQYENRTQRWFTYSIVKAAAFVIFDANGGTINEGKLSYVEEADLDKSLDLTAGRFTPTRSGYVFGGWYLSNDINEEIIDNLTVTTPVTLKANWIAEGDLRVVSFNVNGSVSEKVVTVNSKVTPPVNPVKTGYEFIGWYDGVTEFDFNTPITDDITLVAKFEYTGIITSSTTRIYFYNLYNGSPVFTTVHCFAFSNDADINAAIPSDINSYPGIPAKQVSKNSAYYYVDLPAGATVIFNDGESSSNGNRYQIDDLSMLSNGDNIVIVNNTSRYLDGANKYPVEWVSTTDYNLDAKFLLSANIDDNLVDVKILSTLGKVDDKDFDYSLIQKVGFVIKDTTGLTLNEAQTSTTSIYKDVIVLGESISAEDLGGLYFFSLVFRDVPTNQQLSITPFVILTDGSYVFGATETYIFIAGEL